MNEFFSWNAIDAVVHFATVAYVSEVWLNHYGEFTFMEVPISLHIFLGDTMYQIG